MNRAVVSSAVALVGLSAAAVISTQIPSGDASKSSASAPKSAVKFIDSPGSQTCARPAAGSVVTQPFDLYSHNGQLNVALKYETTLDSDGRRLFCFVTPNGIQSPTLHVNPGDTLNITLTNDIPPSVANAFKSMTMAVGPQPCLSPTMNPTSVNMHFHGANISPTCHSDEVIHTIINTGQTYAYSLKFPTDEPPGLYWYHPHIHGFAEGALQGGASGAIVVDGIEAVQPAVKGLPERTLIIRDLVVAGGLTPGGSVPAWDISLNYVPNSYPASKPGVLPTPPSRREFWRVLNASADTISDVVVRYDGVNQPLTVVALDGVATGSQDGTAKGKTFTTDHLILPPAGRAEFIVTTPSARVRDAFFATRAIDTGPFGDNDTYRNLAILKTSLVGGLASTASRIDDAAAKTESTMATTAGAPGAQRFAGLMTAPVQTVRKLYFSEVLSDPSDPASPTNFYITVDGATPTLFDANNPPAIITHQGAVETWTIENRAQELHVFHIHQIHFVVTAVNGVPVPADQQQFQDTYDVPYWSGKGPYPSITVRMDFRGDTVGDFVYHCHILGHEDNGMMAIIRVLPKG